MADKGKSDTFKQSVNPLLKGAGVTFPFENFTNSALLVPLPQNDIQPLAPLPTDGSEGDSFLGQDEPQHPPPFQTHVVSPPSWYSPIAGVIQPPPAHPPLDSSPNSFNNLPAVPSFHNPVAIVPPPAVSPSPYGHRQQASNSCSPSASPFSNIPIGSENRNPPPSFIPIQTPSAPLDSHKRYFAVPQALPIPQHPPNYFHDTLQEDFIPNSQTYVSPNQAQAPSPSHTSVPLTPPSGNATPSPQPSTIPAEGHQPLGPSPSSAVPSAPPRGGATNLFRIGNVKRPYVPPPDIGIVGGMPVMPDPVLPAHASQPTVLVPEPRDADSSAHPSDGVHPTMADMTAMTSDLAMNPTLPSYQSPVAGQASPPTFLPPAPSSVQSYGQSYRPPYQHWFFKKQIEGKVIWQPFSFDDSKKLEDAFTSPVISPDTKVATDGGRYDVDVLRRQRLSVYWQEDPGEVRRCSWFVKGSLDSRYTPYEEKIATLLEEEYRIASTTNEWNRHVSLPDGEVIILHSANAIAHHLRSSSPDAWGNSPQMQQKPRVVKRGLEDFDIPDGEPETVDHILFLVHGIGKFCDLKFRPVVEVVDEFRSTSLQLLQSHFRGATTMHMANRVEVLPVSWHQALHTEDIDRRLRNITLGSIHRLRQFTNDTLLDILFYTSPIFCETIVQAVGNELNRLYALFQSRNPSFKGGVSLGGHSLGSLILFDMLCNQVPSSGRSDDDGPKEESEREAKTPTQEEASGGSGEEVKKFGCLRSSAKLNRGVSYVTIGTGGTGQPYIQYPQLTFHPTAFFALGSPVGMFVTVRGIDSLGEDFHLPTCPRFFNIFHPFDPVAYRVETLIQPDLANIQPVLIPHHKGRKRMHLELKDTMAHMGAALKQRLVESVKSTWDNLYRIAMFHRTDDGAIEQEVNKVLEDQLMKQQSEVPECGGSGSPDGLEGQEGLDHAVGSLNGGRRIDYVLQEAPIESFNEYLFALSSHVCYWESEDTMLMMLKEIYATFGISPDSQVVQQILPFENGDQLDGGAYPGPSTSAPPAYLPLVPPGGQAFGMDPTAPPSDNVDVGAPPISGFVRK